MESSAFNHSVNKADVDVFKEAQWYLKQGISVIPLWLEPPEEMKIPDGQWGKRPVGSWKKYQAVRATDIELSEWFFSNDYNVGIVTGELSGFVVLDIDSEDAYKLALAKGLPDTPTVKTGRGYHMYYKYVDGVRNFQKRADLPGIDLRGEGGFAVAPPSIHYSSGTRYTWVKGKDLEDLELAELPDWVLAKSPADKPSLKVLEGGEVDGKRNESLTRLLGSWVKDNGHDEVVRMALEWNKKCVPPDNEQQVLNTVKSIWDSEHAGLPDDIGPADWDEPVLFNVGEVPDVEASLLPGFMGDYAVAVSRYTQAPQALPVMVGLSVIATCLQKKFVVSPYGDDEFVEPLNLWTVTALKPSERKTPVFNTMTKPLKQWERDKRESLEEEIIRVKTERDIELKRVESLKQDAVKADTDEKRDEIKQQIADILSGLPVEIMPPRLWTADVTPERLQQLLVDHGEKMSLMSDEGGIFEVLSGMYSNGKVNVDVLLQSYSGSAVRADRGSRDAYLENPALTFCLTVQPGILKGLGQGAKRKFRDNGMLARFLYCIPKGTVGTRDVRNRYTIQAATKKAYEGGINRLLNLMPDTDSEGKERPYVLGVSDEALEVWYGFAQEVEDMLGEGGDMESLADWGGKLAGNALRIAGNFHVVKGNDATTVITSETMTEATELCRVLIPHAKAAFGDMGKDDVASDVVKVYEWLLKKSHREFNKRDCQRGLQSSFPKAENLDPVLRELVARNIIRNVFEKGSKSEKYEVNPAVFRN